MGSPAPLRDSHAIPKRLLFEQRSRARSGGSSLGLLLGLLFGFLSLNSIGCGLSEQTVEQGDRALHDRNGVLLHGNTPFSGTLIERADLQLFRKTPYQHGKRHGQALAWYPSGRLAYQKRFRKGDREGTHTGFWPSGQLQFVYRYEHDLFEGEQVSYYKTGQRAELRHYRRGYEEGQQSAWDGEGRLISNYTVKEGKRYGIVGRFDCVSVH